MGMLCKSWTFFRDKEWKYFLNNQPTLYVNDQVVEFYSTMTHDKDTNVVHTVVTILEQTETSKEYNRIDIDVVSIVCHLFRLSHAGDLIHTNLDLSFRRDSMKNAQAHHTSCTNTLTHLI